MAFDSAPPVLLILSLLFSSSHLSLGHTIIDGDREEVAVGRRVLLSFKETPSGGNLTFECSPSGPCVPCLNSEKNDEKYRCSETGYRIPFKCVESGVGSSKTKSKKSQKIRSTLEVIYDKTKSHVKLHEAENPAILVRRRSLLDDSSTSKEVAQSYITYRSCIPAVNEEKLSVLGFEGIILGMLLISSSVIYFKRKRSGSVPGAGAMWGPTNSRF